MSYITAIGTANPGEGILQSNIEDMMILAHGLTKKEVPRLRALYRASGIIKRYSVIRDISTEKGSGFFHDNNMLEIFTGTGSRMKFYKLHALPLSLEAINSCFESIDVYTESITHLITVSCTGMYAPGLDIDLVNSIGLKSTVARSAINYMGCYAAFSALKIADAICQSDVQAKVLIVCVELCSIHFQRCKTDENMLVNALFGDGAAAVLVENSPIGNTNLEILDSHCDILTEGETEMAWNIDDNGFQMKLSSYVPELIKTGIGKLTQDLLKKLQLNLKDINQFAIHPGGKKILEVIEQELQLTKENNKHAYKVLRNYGNMSSPTVLFVLRSMLSELKNDEKILGVAFGPGLTLESMLFGVCL